MWPSTLNCSDGLPLTINTLLSLDTNARHFPPVSQLLIQISLTYNGIFSYHMLDKAVWYKRCLLTRAGESGWRRLITSR